MNDPPGRDTPNVRETGENRGNGEDVTTGWAKALIETFDRSSSSGIRTVERTIRKVEEVGN